MSFTALDGSTIRELVHTEVVSLAEATVAPSAETIAHHHTFEEVYRFEAGRGRMRVGDAVRDVAAGDVVVLAPGTVHQLWASGDAPLVLLCVCSPPYSDAGTTLVSG